MAVPTMEPTSSKPIESPKKLENAKAPLKHETQAAKVTTEKVDPQNHGKKVASLGEGPDSEGEESSLPPLPSKRDAKQPAITSFFMKSPVKKEPKNT